MFLGAHISIAGGFEKSIDRILDIGGNCLMTFASSPRSLSVASVSTDSIAKYQAKKLSTSIGPHFFHGVYLVNLASDSSDYVQASIASLISYQKLSADIVGAGTIFHIGSHKGRGFVTVKDQIVAAIIQVLENTPDNIMLYLENSAGDTVGSLIELHEIITTISQKNPDLINKLGICLDTQHAWAAGYKTDTLLSDFDHLVGLKYLKCVHLNDSKTEFSSKLDRHENLGQGLIGSKLLKIFVNDPRLVNIPLILEVPGDAKSGPGKRDVDTLKSLIDNYS